MADNDEPDDVELASAYLDGEVSADERARVDGDPALLAHVERLRQVRTAVGDVAPPSPATREEAILAALAAFDELSGGSTQPAPPVAPTNVVPLERQRRMRRMHAAITAAAAAAVLLIGGLVIANRGDDDDATTQDVREAAPITLEDAGAAIEVTSTAPTAAAGPATTATTAQQAEATAEQLEAADAPMVAAPTETAMAESATDATGAPAAAGSPVVVHDADELRDLGESLAPPSDASVMADCERDRLAIEPAAVVEEADGTVIPVAVASTADGYAAVSLDDCTIVLRAPPPEG